MEENETIKEAVEELTGMSKDEELRRIADLREKGRRDHVAAMQYATEQGWNRGWNRGIKAGKKEGIKQGKEEGMKQGIEEGMKQGIEEGIEEGMKQGIKQGIKEIAKKMLENGIPIEKIEKITGLTKEEIEI